MDRPHPPSKKGLPKRHVLAPSTPVHRLRFLLLGLLSATAPLAVGGDRPPNIVLILADDLGWADTAFSGSRYYETPHLDAFAASGMRFTSFYTSPNCAPTRASLLSGQYASRTGVYTVGSLERGEDAARRMIPPPNQTHLPSGLPTLASTLRNAGYLTGLIGKWHLGEGSEHHPTRFGFVETVVTTGPHKAFDTDPHDPRAEGAYLTDYLTDRAIEFVERHQDRPFFLYLAHLAVHSPYQAKPEWIERFARRPPAGTHRDAVYAAMIASLDEAVGRLLARLDQLELSRRTVVIFASDNGGVGGYATTDAAGRRIGPTDNAPLRGGKGMLYEGGIRVPFLIRWPNVTQPGSRSAQPAIHVDLLPTLAEIARTRPPTGHPIDGVSLVPILRDPNARLGRDAIYWHFPGYLEGPGRSGWRITPSGAIRAGNFKLIESFEDQRLELYNLAEDIGERNNLVRSLPDKTAELRAKLAAWRQDLNAAMPQPNPPAAEPARARP
ncbi:MAG: sulfatase [Verrucomicrobiae bacterium]|nr:sulfatase [Verrucomicrobiae bacterium]